MQEMRRLFLKPQYWNHLLINKNILHTLANVALNEAMGVEREQVGAEMEKLFLTHASTKGP